MKKRLIRVREEDAAALAILGREIWEEHYTSILGPEQVAYMVREFQSEPAVLHQMREERMSTGSSPSTARGPVTSACSRRRTAPST